MVTDLPFLRSVSNYELDCPTQSANAMQNCIFAIRERLLWLGASVVVSWILTGPAYLWYTNLFAEGVRGPLMAAGAEIALLGTAILWLISLWALHLARPSVLGNRATLVQQSRRTAPGEGRVPFGTTLEPPF